MVVDASGAALAVRAIIAAHGTLAAGFVSAVDKITGRGAAFRAVANDGMSAEDILASLTHAVDETGARVIFTDLPAGSCTMAARKLLRLRPHVTIIAGVNLPLLLDFAMRDGYADGAAVQAAAERARAMMAVYSS